MLPGLSIVLHHSRARSSLFSCRPRAPVPPTCETGQTGLASRSSGPWRGKVVGIEGQRAKFDPRRCQLRGWVHFCTEEPWPLGQSWHPWGDGGERSKVKGQIIMMMYDCRLAVDVCTCRRIRFQKQPDWVLPLWNGNGDPNIPQYPIYKQQWT